LDVSESFNSVTDGGGSAGTGRSCIISSGTKHSNSPEQMISDSWMYFQE
jgi:hypothetical protein